MKIRLLTLFLIPLGPLAALDYEKDIMPIFVEKCSDCHSRASGQSKGGLILDDPKHLLVRVEGGTVHLRMTNGSIYPYPVEQLSDECRAALK